MNNNQCISPDNADIPLFPRLCKEYSKQVFDNLITVKDIKRYILRGNRVYGEARSLIDEHINQTMIETSTTSNSDTSFVIDDEDGTDDLD